MKDCACVTNQKARYKGHLRWHLRYEGLCNSGLIYKPSNEVKVVGTETRDVSYGRKRLKVED